MSIALPPRLLERSQHHVEGRIWLARLPQDVAELTRRWSLRIEPSTIGEGATCSFVALVRCADDSPAVLKLGLPHMEAEHELEGLRFWNGDPSVRVLRADPERSALLLERCDPGHPLSTQSEDEQDRVIASLLRRLWREPAAGHPFRALSTMARYWADAQLARELEWPDAGVVRAGVAELLELAGDAETGNVLLATDLHAGNVLSARRAPWLVIDPKPFMGDPAYDVTQHLLNGVPRLARDPRGTVARIADLAGVDARRVQRWMFARLAVSARTLASCYGLSGADAVALARRVRSDAC